MEEQLSLFGTYKQCKFCFRPLPVKFEADLCPRCQEAQLFKEVREYIRTNDVNEYEVAQHFGIPLRTVRDWIREGRIEYKARDAEHKAVLSNLHCEICGAQVQFGVLCPKCSRELHAKKGFATSKLSGGDDSRMRFLDQ